jgi:DNA polymerase III alpha subunit
MLHDKFGNPLHQLQDLTKLIYQEILEFEQLLVEPSAEITKFNGVAGTLLHSVDPAMYDISINTFDTICQGDWFIPQEYQKFNITKFCLDKCNAQAESTRVLEEIEAFEERKMMPLLRTLKYLVDTLREHGVLWGVGRGSSVASYVLFLLEIHRIDSLKYDLDWHEFLR